jgi:hypothetical protein
MYRPRLTFRILMILLILMIFKLVYIYTCTPLHTLCRVIEYYIHTLILQVHVHFIGKIFRAYNAKMN